MKGAVSVVPDTEAAPLFSYQGKDNMPEDTKLWNGKFILIFCTNLLMYGVFYALNPVLPVYGGQRGFSAADIGIMLSIMSLTTILFRPLAGYLLDNFNRYLVFVIFLFLLCLTFFSYTLFATLTAILIIRLFTGAFWSVCGSSTVTLAGDTLPPSKIRIGINRFTLTIALGMAVGPYIGIQVQNYVSSQAMFYVLFGMALLSFILALGLRLKYPKNDKKPFKLSSFFYKPALPFMFMMMFIMIPYGAFLVYTAVFARAKGLGDSVALFYVFMSVGLIISKFVTQKITDSGNFKLIVAISLAVLAVALYLFQFVSTPLQLFIMALALGLGYGVLQPLFQSLVTNIAPGPKRGVANATYLLSYDIGIGLGAYLMGQWQTTIGLGTGFAYVAIAYLVGAVIYYGFVQRYYQNKLEQMPAGGPGGPGATAKPA